MKLFPVFALSLVYGLLLVGPVFAQGICILNLNLANHNRYAYKTEEECPPSLHTVPWGNWGVSSNVGSKRDTDQFKGWDRDCAQVKVQWNSCSVNSRYRTSSYLNFPATESTAPLPGNGYPFSDSYGWNDFVPPHGASYRVDQYSPCGANSYGGLIVSIPVPALLDTNNDGVMDAGGCKILDGQTVIVQNNFLSVYELDDPDEDDLIQTMFFPEVRVRLSCTPYACFAVNDRDTNGTIDDLDQQFSPEYQWPVRYQQGSAFPCEATVPGVPCKKIDATIRVGYVYGYLFPTPIVPPGNERRRIVDTPRVSTRSRSLAGRLLMISADAFGLRLFPELFDEPPARHNRITGRVIERDTGDPLAAEIGVALQTSEGIIFKHLTVAADGLFELDAPSAASVHFSTKLEGFASAHQSVFVEEGETRHLEFQVVRSKLVRGAVTDAGGAAMPGAQIRVIHAEENPANVFAARWQWETGEIKTETDGSFIVEVDPEREFVIEVSRQGFRSIVTPTRSSESFLRMTLQRSDQRLDETESESNNIDLRRFPAPELLRQRQR